MTSANTNERVLLTGIAGFIGSHIAQALLRRGTTVIGIDDFDPFYDRAIKERNLAEIQTVSGTSSAASGSTVGQASGGSGALEASGGGGPSGGGAGGGGELIVAEMDMADTDRVGALMREHRITGIIHLAACAGVRPSIEDPRRYAANNVEATTALLDLARRIDTCDRFIMASSSSVYGNNKKVPFAETDDVGEPISPYAATKRACELMGHTFHHLYRLPVACLRFFTVYGPRQRPDLAIAKFMRLIDAGRPIPVFGDGTAARDYTYIDDVVGGVIAALDRIPEHGFRIWNLGSHEPVTLARLVELLEGVTGITPEIERMAAQPGDVAQTFADVTRAGAELGYAPSTPIAEGMRRQWAWFRSAAAPSIAAGASRDTLPAS